MPILKDYHHFDGLHWETGSVCNHFAYRGFKAPHTGQPFSEAMFMGISGGAVMGYFSFAYQGYDPHVAILTRNTFSPLETLLARLGVEQTLQQTGNPDKAVAHLMDCLADGLPPLVWADMYSLPYNALSHDDGMWVTFPLIVYGYEAETVWIADRARVPLTITAAELATARARVKKLKFRLLTLDLPNPDKLVSAVQKGIWDCLKLYTEAPPKGSKSNFGLAAMKRWAELLTQPKQRMSWAKEFPPGRKLYAGLTSSFNFIALFGQDGQKQDAERAMYADFLAEAGLVLSKPALHQAAQQFRLSGQAWASLAQALLPDQIPLFAETRRLMLRKHRLFLEQGNAALPEIQEINLRLKAIKAEVTTNFPLNQAEVATLQENLREHVLKVHDIEQEAIKILQGAMSG
jgi:F0F1-type ATP synthase delta subunit